MAKNNEMDSGYEEHSTLNITSMVINGVASVSMSTFIGAQLFFFYEVELLLPVVYVGLAFFILGLWDTLNEFTGYFLDKKTPFTRRFGRRFPYLIISIIPLVIVFLLLFSPPSIDAKTDPVPIFLWLLVLLLINELFMEISQASKIALCPEKYRSDSERKKFGYLLIGFEQLGLVFGLVVPMLLIWQGDPSTYISTAVLILIPSLILFILGIPGIREDESMRIRACRLADERKEKGSTFFKILKTFFSNKNYLAKWLTGLTYVLVTISLNASLVYWVRYVLLEPGDSAAIAVVIYMLTQVLGVFLWKFCAKKMEYKKALLISCGILFISGILAVFVRGFAALIILPTLWGIAVGGILLFNILTSYEIVDEVSLKLKDRNEGFFFGILEFGSRFGAMIQPIILTAIHLITDFQPESVVQTEFAQQGIIAAMSWIPATLMLIAALIFWKVYGISKEQAESMKKQLFELGL